MTLPATVAAWRKQQRAELIRRREAISPEHRRTWSDALTRLLIESFPDLAQATVGFCWPYKGEFDVRFAIRHWRERGGRAALPGVVAKDAPLEFRLWWPGVETAAGVFGIPVPQGTEVVFPDVLLIPPVGFDQQGYRLGYGGGYFDGTLASMTPQPLKIAVAFEPSRIPSIRPQPHDIPMDFVVTPNGVHHVDARRLIRLDGPADVQAVTARTRQERRI